MPQHASISQIFAIKLRYLQKISHNRHLSTKTFSKNQYLTVVAFYGKD